LVNQSDLDSGLRQKNAGGIALRVPFLLSPSKDAHMPWFVRTTNPLAKGTFDGITANGSRW